jgi:hypothetical protein
MALEYISSFQDKTKSDVGVDGYGRVGHPPVVYVGPERRAEAPGVHMNGEIECTGHGSAALRMTGWGGSPVTKSVSGPNRMKSVHGSDLRRAAGAQCRVSIRRGRISARPTPLSYPRRRVSSVWIPDQVGNDRRNAWG